MARLARGLPQKQDGIKIVTRAPSGADGKAGDMRLLAKSSVEGAVLYVKSGNKWFPFQSGIDTSTPAKKLFEASVYGSGYQVLDSGLIIQWGYVSTNSTVTFPIAFPTICFSIVFGSLGTTGGIPSVTVLSPLSFTYNSAIVNNQNAWWQAIGH